MLHIQIFNFVQGKHASSENRIQPQAVGDSATIYLNKCHFQKRGTNPKFLDPNVEDSIYIQPPASSPALILSGSHCQSTWRTSALSPGPKVCGLGPSYLISHITPIQNISISISISYSYL